MSVRHFGDRVVQTARHLGNPLCVTLEPELSLIPVEFGVSVDEPASDATARGVNLFLHAVLEECAGGVPAVQPHSAFFEQLGWRGIQVWNKSSSPRVVTGCS